ncbi:hypothetical protein [Oceanobacillus sp. FSL H7-0719]|uniref:hypothetical protein n=1 Tax=Oceanobacillus sp. FSL H7-0719 TaxID=2954507 RepID=UPI00324A9B13
MNKNNERNENLKLMLHMLTEMREGQHELREEHLEVKALLKTNKDMIKDLVEQMDKMTVLYEKEFNNLSKRIETLEQEIAYLQPTVIH